MDCVKQINALFSKDNQDLIKSQISTFDSSSSVKADSTKLKKPTKATTSSRTTSEKSPKTKTSYNNKKPAVTKHSKVESIKTSKGHHTSKKMSDWGDEETTDVIGKGFGNEAYKSYDNDYQNENNNDNDGYKKRYDGGRNGGGGDGGRGGGRNGKFNRYNNRNDDANEEYRESNEHYQNPIFALTPKDFSQENLQDFIKNMPELFRKATLVQKYTLMKYLMEAYERTLKKFSKIAQKQQKQRLGKKSCATAKVQELQRQQLQKTFDEQLAFSPKLRTQDAEQELTFILHTRMPSPQSDTIDLLQIFQQDSNEHGNENYGNTFQYQFQETITMAAPQMSTKNISDLITNSNLTSCDDLELSFLRETKQRDVIDKHKEKNLPNNDSTVSLVKQVNAQSNQPPKTAPNIIYQCETPPATPKLLKPRTFISEEEYSLRFRLPRRKLLEISILPQVKYNTETSSFAYFPMNINLIEEESFGDIDDKHLTFKNNSEMHLRHTTNTLVVPSSLPPLTLSALTTGESLSTINVVRQATSSVLELSSFPKPFLPAATIDMSRIREDDVQNYEANVSIDSVQFQEEGQHFLQQQKEQLNLMDEAITVPDIEPAPQITTDSGINFPTSNLLTRDMIRSISNMESDPQMVVKGQPQPDNSSSSDTGIFKTPFIPPRILLQQKTTVSSVEEQIFQSKLSTRRLDVSTPLTILEEPHKIKTQLTVSEGKNANISDVVSSEFKEQMIEQSTDIGLQPIEEAKEFRVENINEDNAQQSQTSQLVHQTFEQINRSNTNNLITQPNTDDDDYRKDWYEILRARLKEANYKDISTPKRKLKHRHLKRRPPHLIQQISQQQENLEQQPIQNNVSTSNILQETLAGILPSIQKDPPEQNLNASPKFNTTGNSGNLPLVLNISSEQQQYNEFILDNSENITTIMDNLSSCRVMLEKHRRALLTKLSNGIHSQPCLHFDPEVLLNASKKRLSVKLELLQNIIRQVSFDFTKCDCIKDPMTAAMGFAFLLELKSAGIINLSSDGRTVSLR